MEKLNDIITEEELKELIQNLNDQLILHSVLKEPIDKNLDSLLKLSISYEKLLQENKDLKNIIKNTKE